MIKLDLKPRSVVAKTEGFEDLLRESEAAVKECRLILKQQWMKCTEMNVLSQEHDIARRFAAGLLEIAELLLAEAGIDGDKHIVVSDLLHLDRDRVLAFLNVTDEFFKNKYLKIHNLDVFPTPSLGRSAPDGPVLMRRGGPGGD